MTYVAAGTRLRARALLVVVMACLGLGGLGASSAWAGKGVTDVFGSSGSGDGQFASAGAMAVNGTSGDVYVVDSGQSRVERFDSGGSFLGAFGWGVADGNTATETCASGCQAGIAGGGDGQFDGPQGIAVDSSGSVYVVDGNNGRVEKFDAGGSFVSQFGSAGSGDGQLSGPQGVAIDPTDGSVYVADSGNNRVEKFDSSGAFVDAFGFGVSDGASGFEVCTSSCQAGLADSSDGAFNFPTRVAVDSGGQVYVLDAGNGRVERFTSADAFDEQFDQTDVNASTFPFEIAVGPGNDHLYVAQAAPDFSEQRVFEIDASGSLVDTHGVGSTASQSSGLALSSGAQRIYLADGANARVFILDDITAPTFSLSPASSITSTSASLSGSVTPNGDPNVGWHFETSTDDVNWSPVAADQDAGNGNTPVPVSQDLTGLAPNTTYFVRLAGTRPFNAAAFSSEIQFTTGAIAPDATTESAFDMSATQATVEGQVDPHHSPTTYYFQYGPTTAYGESQPVAQNADAGSADAAGLVVQRLSGLQPQTTYHYRLVANNQAGTAHGSDQTLTTTPAPPASTPRPAIPGAGFLPDNRGWEKVSPNDKNGGDIMADSQRTRVADDGNAVNFPSLAGFADAIGTSIATDYMSVRGADGWATHSIMPKQAPLTINQIQVRVQPLYTGAFSTDLASGIFLGWSPVTSDPSVANVTNLYLRTDLKNPGPGSYELVSACPLCATAGTPLPPLPTNIPGDAQPYFAGASSDYGHVIFESQQRLTGDAPTGCTNLANVNLCPGNLYEWDHGTTRLVGILPDGTPAHGSQAGQGAGGYQAQPVLTPHAISTDGSRVIFTVPSAPRSPSGNLYMRVDQTRTIQLNASERSQADPGGPRPASYWDASTDGLRVFFTTPEALTNDAPADGSMKLYMYDAGKPDSDPHNLTLINSDAEPADPGDAVTVLGASHDGHFVYFSAVGQLVAGGPVLGTSRAIYVWHDGDIRYVARTSDVDLVTEDSTTADWLIAMPTARVTPDGSHLLFSSTDAGVGPTGYDQGHCGDVGIGPGCREFYVYSFEDQRVACVSCNPTGAPATSDAFTAVQTNNSAALTTWTQNHPMSDDGHTVFFSTADALVPQDDNGKIDVYEYDVPTGTVHLITTGRDRSDSYFMNASPSGSDVFFLTRAQLVGSDIDTSYDLYDAKVNGGFLAPAPASPECSGEPCQGSVTPPPGSLAGRGSSVIAGPSGPQHGSKPRPKKPASCRKGYVRKKVRGKTRCVKKPRARKARRTSVHGRAVHSGRTK